MKKNVVLLALSLCAVGFEGSRICAAEQAYGKTSYGKETIDSIHSSGTVTLDGTTVLEIVQVNGLLEASNATLDSLEVKGKAVLRNCSIKKKSEVKGALIADQTKFEKEIIVTSHEISFSKCTIDSIVVNKDKEFQSTQIIELHNGTKVAGAISFESGSGEVWIFSDSSISGPVKGGKIIRK